jgi:uncharacterized membrane-anchored protein
MIFVGYIWWQEYSITTGTKVWLQTKPVDPRDFFRGDYVILSYDIDSACDLPMIDNGDTDEFSQTIKIPQHYDENDMTGREKMMGGKSVYVPLVLSGDVMVASGCVSDMSTNGIYIKGLRQNYSRTLYGIEKYFVQQGKGLDMERAVGKMQVQVSISKNGQARIVDYKLD